MIISIKVPDEFVPEENEYRGYCAIKLFKGKYITKEEAIKMCGYARVNETTEKIFNVLYTTFEKKYKKMCGPGYADEDFLDDIKLEEESISRGV